MSFLLTSFGAQAVVPQAVAPQAIVPRANENQPPSTSFQFPPSFAQAPVPQLPPPSDRRETRSQGNQSYRPKAGASAISQSSQGFIAALSRNEGAACNTFRDGEEAENSAGSRDLEGSAGELSHHYVKFKLLMTCIKTRFVTRKKNRFRLEREILKVVRVSVLIIATSSSCS